MREASRSRLASECIKILDDSQSKATDRHVAFQNAAKNTPRQAFVMMNVSCDFESASYDIFCGYSCNGEISLHTVAA